jgi:hypothetical protein
MRDAPSPYAVGDVFTGSLYMSMPLAGSIASAPVVGASEIEIAADAEGLRYLRTEVEGRTTRET